MRRIVQVLVGLIAGISLAVGPLAAQDSARVEGMAVRLYWAALTGADSARLRVLDSATGKSYLNTKVPVSSRSRLVTIPVRPDGSIYRTVRRLLAVTRAGVTQTDTVFFPYTAPPSPPALQPPRVDSVTISPLVYDTATKRVTATAAWFSSDTGTITWGGTTANGPIGPTQTRHLINWLIASTTDTVTFYACPKATRHGLTTEPPCVRRGLRIVRPAPAPPDTVVPPPLPDTVVTTPPDTGVTPASDSFAELPRVFVDTRMPVLNLGPDTLVTRARGLTPLLLPVAEYRQLHPTFVWPPPFTPEPTP